MAESGHMNAMAVSSMASSMCWPLAVPVARANNAAVMACVAVYAVALSQTNVRNNSGVPVAGWACTLASPDAAWITLS